MSRRKISSLFRVSRFSAPAIGVMVLAAVVLSAPRASAWGVYYLDESNPNCTTCHPGFQGGPSGALHKDHVNDFVALHLAVGTARGFLRRAALALVGVPPGRESRVDDRLHAVSSCACAHNAAARIQNT